MSTVYLGFDCRTFQFSAVKVLLERFSDNEVVVNRMRREADIYSQLNHKNIVGFIEAGEYEDGYFIAQEYLRGDPLRNLLDAFPEGLPFQAALNVLSDLAGALHVAHCAGIIHRDVQPDNIIIDHEGSAKLCDFGIAYADDSHIITEEGTIMGTVLYSSPEQNRGQEVDERADLYSLGAILYEMLTGQRLNQGTTLEEAMEFQLRALPDMRALNPEIPSDLETITRKLLAPDAEQRYWEIKDLLIDMGKLRVEASLDELDKLYGHPFFRKLREGLTLFGEGKLEEAVALASELESKYKEYEIGDLSKVYYLLGRGYARLGRAEKAVRYFDKALFADPGNIDYALDFAIELVREKRLERARKLIAQICQGAPSNLLACGLSALLAREGGIPSYAKTKEPSWFEKLISRFLPGQQ